MQHGNVKCTDCHMPQATKSAVAVSKCRADVKTNLFRINLDPNAKMFMANGDFANGYQTVKYACLGCHTRESRTWALTMAKQNI